MPHASVLKRGQVQNLSCENDFYYHANKTHFYKKGFVTTMQCSWFYYYLKKYTRASTVFIVLECTTKNSKHKRKGIFPFFANAFVYARATLAADQAGPSKMRESDWLLAPSSWSGKQIDSIVAVCSPANTAMRGGCIRRLAVCLFSYRSQTTSKCSKKKKLHTSRRRVCHWCSYSWGSSRKSYW